MQALNSPIELGVRSLIVLTAAFPKALDLSRLVLMDYCLLHSADLGGPESVFPPLPARTGELGMKRTVIEHGIHVMVQAGMIDALATSEGILYRARDEARPFLQLLRSPHTTALTVVAQWIAHEFSELSEDQIRGRMISVTSRWSEEFAWSRALADNSGSEGIEA